MISQEMLATLNTIRTLSSTQVQKCQDFAKDRVTHINGEAPNRQDFEKAFPSLMNWVDYVLFLLYVAVLTISLTHLIFYGAELASESWDVVREGANYGLTKVFSKDSYIILHQLSLFAMSEAGIIFFMVRYHRRKEKILRDMFNEGFLGYLRYFITKHVSFNIIAASWCALLVIIANLQSEVGAFLGLLIAFLTILMSERVSELVSELEFRKETIEIRYTEEMDEWSKYNLNPDIHPSFMSFLQQAIVDLYKKNTRLNVEWTPELEEALSLREVARLRMLDDDTKRENMLAFFMDSNSSEQMEQEQPKGTEKPELNLLKNAK